MNAYLSNYYRQRYFSNGGGMNPYMYGNQQYNPYGMQYQQPEMGYDQQFANQNQNVGLSPAQNGMMQGTGLQYQQSMNSIEQNANTAVQNEQNAGQAGKAVGSAIGKAGPWGAAISAVSGAGYKIGEAVGGDAGGALKGTFKPETIAMNKNLSTGKRIVGTLVPTLGGVWASRADKEAKEEAEAKARDLNEKTSLSQNRLGNLNNQEQYSFANGGNILLNSYQMANGGGIPITQTNVQQAPYVQDPLELAGSFRDLYKDKSANVGESFELKPGSAEEKQIRGIYNYPYKYAAPYTDETGQTQYYPVLGTGEHEKLIKQRGLTSRTLGAKGYANGGKIQNSTDGLNNMTYYANGGTHQENKLGGIPIGNNGKVEEGEFRYNDFIFSNRF